MSSSNHIYANIAKHPEPDIENYASTVDATEPPNPPLTGTSPAGLARANSRDGKTKHEVFGHTSHFWVQPHESFDGDPYDKVLRSLFIQKVYGILTCQLMLTAVVSMLFMYVNSFHMFALQHGRLLLFFSVIGGFGSLFGLMAYKDTYPNNIYLLASFTGFESIMMGFICALYQEVGLGDIIFQAFAITWFVFVLLTLFATTSKVDFTPYQGFFVAVLGAMIVWSFISMLFGFPPGYLYSWLGVLVFSAFVVIDTQMIIDKFGYEDYIVASIELYLDFINMFLFILQLLTGSNQDRN